MYPEIRRYHDPYEGLKIQLAELRGLAKTVPPLIEADRERRWEEIGSRPGDPDDDMMEAYERESGSEEGYGFAEYDRTIYAASLIMAWEIFREYLALKLKVSALNYKVQKYPPLAQLIDEETRTWDRRFDRIEQRYREFLGIPVTSWPHWSHVRHANELRNALVHNLGIPTPGYLRIRPDRDRREPIPLSAELAEEVVIQLLEAASEIQAALENRQNSSGSA